MLHGRCGSRDRDRHSQQDAIGKPDNTQSAGNIVESVAQRAAAFLDRFNRAPPFSFMYGGRTSSVLLSQWRRAYSERPSTPTRPGIRSPGRIRDGGLVVRCEAVEFHDYPTVDWTLYFKNAGAHNSLPLSDVLALDTAIQAGAGPKVIVHTCNGSAAVTQDYGLQEIDLAARSSTLFTCMGGRPTNGNFRPEVGISRSGSPYYNIDWGGEGSSW